MNLLGLNNIKNRSYVYKGKVNIASAPGKGCTVAVYFPLSFKPNQPYKKQHEKEYHSNC